MSNRNTGIGHIAARSLIEEIAALRDDIRTMGIALSDIDLSLLLLFQELRRTNAAQRAALLPPDHE